MNQIQLKIRGSIMKHLDITTIKEKAELYENSMSFSSFT